MQLLRFESSKPCRFENKELRYLVENLLIGYRILIVNTDIFLLSVLHFESFFINAVAKCNIDAKVKGL